MRSLSTFFFLTNPNCEISKNNVYAYGKNAHASGIIPTLSILKNYFYFLVRIYYFSKYVFKLSIICFSLHSNNN